jgi:hypothetical protein
MAANATQAVGVTTFLLGFTALSGAIYKGGSILLFLVTAVLLGTSVAAFRKCKPLENAEN